MNDYSSVTDINGSFTLSNGVEMPYLGLGVFKVQDGKQVLESVQYALEAGYRHIDTAAIYQNERGVGKAIRNSGIPREKIFLTSKVWNSDQGYESTLQAYDLSLKKLETDYLDLYLIHWPVRGKYKETWRALEKIYSEGRVKAIGVSNFLKHHLQDLLPEVNVVPMVDQVEFHPYLLQKELFEFCLEHQIQYEAWSPIMRGKVVELEILKKMAKKYQRTEVQITLRWDLQKGVITIPKSIQKERIISNAQLFDFEISFDDMKQIDGMDCTVRYGADPDNFNF